MRKCIVPGCDKCQVNKINIPGVTFHRVPKNETRRSAWLTAMGLKHCLSLSKQAVVCSTHFTDECFDKTSACGIVRLRDESIPTLSLPSMKYDHSKECSPSIAPKMYKPEQISTEFIELVNVPEEPSLEDDPLLSVASTSAGLLSTKSTQTSQAFYVDLVSRQKLTMELKEMTLRYKAAQRELQHLRRKNQRRKKKLANMKNIVSQFSKNRLLGNENLKFLLPFSDTSKEISLKQLKRTGNIP